MTGEGKLTIEQLCEKLSTPAIFDELDTEELIRQILEFKSNQPGIVTLGELLRRYEDTHTD